MAAVIVCVYANYKHDGKQITKKIPFTLPYAPNADFVGERGGGSIGFRPPNFRRWRQRPSLSRNKQYATRFPEQ